MLPDSYDESLFCTDGFTEISFFLCQVGAYFEQQFIEFVYSHPIKLKKPLRIFAMISVMCVEFPLFTTFVV